MKNICTNFLTPEKAIQSLNLSGLISVMQYEEKTLLMSVNNNITVIKNTEDNKALHLNFRRSILTRM